MTCLDLSEGPLWQGRDLKSRLSIQISVSFHNAMHINLLFFWKQKMNI